MRNLILGFWVVVGALLATGVEGATSSASFQYPNVDGLIVNYVDTIFLQWTSNYGAAYLQMWCQNGTTGNNVVLGSQSPVVTSGRFGYVLTNQDPAQAAFPVACHAAIVPDPLGGGVDAPFGITFTSQLKVAAQTFSLAATTTTSSSSATTTSKSSSSAILASSSSSIQTSSLSVATSSSSVVSSSVGSSTAATPGAGSITTSSSTSSSTAVKTPTSVTTNSSNLGPIVGGVLGGLFLLCFIIFGALFLRRYRQPPSDNEIPSSAVRGGRWHRNTYRTTEMQTGGLHEIEGNSAIRHEKEGSTPAMKYEKEGDLAKVHEIDGRAKSKRWTPFELPT